MTKPPSTDLTQPGNPPLSLPPRPGVFRPSRANKAATLGELLASDPEQLAKLLAQAGPDGTINVIKKKPPTSAGYLRKKAKATVGRHLVERTDSRGLPIILIETAYDDGSADVSKYK